MGELDLSKDQGEAGDATSLAPGSALAWRPGSECSPSSHGEENALLPFRDSELPPQARKKSELLGER